MAIIGRRVEKNKAIVRRIPEEIQTERRLDLMEEVFAEDVVEHGSPLGDVEGRDALKATFEGFQKAFPDLRVTVEHLVGEDEFVALHVRVRGTQDGPFMGVDPSGSKLDITGLVLHRIEDGMVAERWVYFDRLAWLNQLGISPDELER